MNLKTNNYCLLRFFLKLQIASYFSRHIIQSIDLVLSSKQNIIFIQNIEITIRSTTEHDGVQN